MSVGEIIVPSEGKKPSKIMCIGEAPGEDEEHEGRPFIGKSGQFLERYLGRSGVRREDVYLANLYQRRPRSNKFEYCRVASDFEESLERLRAEITDVDPNIIIALGAWPMYYLTGCISDAKSAKPGSGISLWRGSTMPCTLCEGYKVYITYHPAYIIRPQGFELSPVFLSDIRRAVDESHTKEFVYPKYEEIIDPPADTLDLLVDELCRADWLTIDIETFGSELACVGVTDSTSRGICLTALNKDRNWDAAQIILKSQAKKNFQYGAFDINYLWHYYGWETENFAWDSYVAANNLMPGFPKGLDFLASVYTRLPYYKTERKVWKNTMDLQRLWSYNIKDLIAQHTIMLEQVKEIGWIPVAV